MICPKCGKTIYNGRTSCPFCGETVAVRRSVAEPRGTRAYPRATAPAAPVRRPDPAAVPPGRGQAAVRRQTEGNRATYSNGPIARPPQRPAGTVHNPGRAYGGQTPNRRGKKANRSGRTAVFVIALIAVVIGVAVLFFSGAFEKSDDTSLGRTFIESLLKGDTDKAFKMLPYDPAKVYRDGLKAELDGDFGGDFDKFYEKYKLMGVSATDFDSFVNAAYAKISSEFKLGFVGLSSGKYSVDIETVNKKSYAESELEAYRNGLSRSFARDGADISKYFDVGKIEAADEVSYKVRVSSQDGTTQESDCILHLVTVLGERRVIPEGGRLIFSHTGVTGVYTVAAEGKDITVTFRGDGTGEVVSGDKSVPLTYRAVGTDGLSINCAAFGDGETVCTYSISNGVLTLTLPDGIMELKKAG